MPNNPVQIVVNDEAFLRAPDPKRGGLDKDFFEGRDAEFVRHRDSLIAELTRIEKEVARWQFGPLCYLRVRMRLEAIAKSYRPNRAIFLPDQFPCVGAGTPGELFFRAPLIHFKRLQRHINSAEDHGETRVSRETGKAYHFVTRARCEVGAIETIELYPANLKREFSADAAVAALSDPRAASGYLVELFETQPLIVANGDALGFHSSVASLQAILREGGPGLIATILPSPGTMPLIEVILTTQEQPALIDDRRVVQLHTEASSASLPVQLDRDVQRHEILLRRLAKHPLVRRIRFPILIQTTETASSTSGAFPLIGRVSDGRYPKVGVIDTGIAGPLKAWVLDRHDFLDEVDCDPTHGSMVAGVLVAARGANGPQLG